MPTCDRKRRATRGFTLIEIAVVMVIIAIFLSMGAVMFRAITGRAIHEGRTPTDRLFQAMKDRAPSLASVIPGIPMFVSGLVDKALGRAPASPDAPAPPHRPGLRPGARGATRLAGGRAGPNSRRWPR